MNLFDRLAWVIKSYANSVLSCLEDPEKKLEQAVLEMNDDLTKMRQATAQIANTRAKSSRLLSSPSLTGDNASSLKAQLNRRVSNTWLLESKIQEARSKKDTLKACAQSAKTATKVSEMLGNVNTSNALSAFQKMEGKVMAMESQAEAVGQLTTDDLEGKFALLENSSVDDDLASLKGELSGSSPVNFTYLGSCYAEEFFKDLFLVKHTVLGLKNLLDCKVALFLLQLLVLLLDFSF
ncbi:membrane-associated protein VIPP1, chloroplastic-like isoform X2 [Elaeis guineensis]